MRLLARWALAAAITAATFVASNYQVPDWDEWAARQARAQEESATPIAPADTPSPTPTPVPSTIPTPTETPSPEPSAPSPTFTVETTPSATATPTATPAPAPPLPPITDEPSPIGSYSESIVGTAGGRVATPDGRVVLDFPAGALAGASRISVLVREHESLPFLSNRIQRAWDLSAVSDSGAGAPVQSFPQPVTITLRAAHGDFDMNPGSIKLWRLDEANSVWVPVPATLDASTYTLVASLDHFSGYGLSGDPDALVSSFTDITSVNLHTGAARLAVPIDVPAWPGGLTPELLLNYDSDRVNGMTNKFALASWAGIGWELSTGSISGTTLSNSMSIEFSGVSGPFYRDTVDGSWQLVDTRFDRVELVGGTADWCWLNPCTWRVTDKRGVQYFFGENSGIRYRYVSASYPRVYYQWDLTRVRNPLGNEITIGYVPLIACVADCGTGSPKQAVVDSYPNLVSWNGGRYKVEFDTGPDTDYVYVNADWPRVRQDNPRHIYCNGSLIWSPPKIMEIRRLKSVRVKVNDGATDSLLRQYDLDYDTTNFSDPSNCGSAQNSGKMTLKSVIERGRNGGALRTMNFTYGYNSTLTYIDPGHSGIDTFTWPLLTNWTNGFGGSVAFGYEQKQNAGDSAYDNWEYCWTVSVVNQRTATFGAGQPTVVSSFSYAEGPDNRWNTVPFGSPDLDCDTPIIGTARPYNGFQRVTETDAAANTTEHVYYTSRSADAMLRTSREQEAIVKSSTGEVWHRLVNTWNHLILEGDPTQEDRHSRFVFLDRSDEYLKDNTQLGTDYTYDSYGNLTQTWYQGVAGDADDLKTNTAFHLNTTDWIFLPKYQEQRDYPANTLLICQRFYYDGAKLISTSPVRGLLTAQSTATSGATTCDGATALPASTNAYSVFDTYGNPTQASVAIAGAPESQTQGGDHGWIPSGVASTATVYDGTYHVLPISQMDPLGHMTSLPFADYDAVLGKPKKVIEPTGQTIEIRYDEFGRTTKVWDNLAGNSETYPSAQYTYAWGSVPNMTTIDRRTVAGTSSVAKAHVCRDGFGREYERHEYYQGTSLNRTRTQYDARGLVAAKSNPAAYGATACPTTVVDITSLDRTAYAYDPLGNVTRSTALPASASNGPFSETLYVGATTLMVDERFNVTEHTRDFGNRKLTVKEPAASSAILRPNGQGNYAQWVWDVYPSGPHYLNVDESTPDDSGSYYHDGSWGLKDTQTYPGAGLPSGTTIAAVRFRFRWKHFDGGTPNPSGPNMWAIFRQSGVDTRGPTYQSNNAAGWRDDSWHMTANPRTGQPWTLSEVNAGLEFGFETYATVGSNPYITQAYLEVLYAGGGSTAYQYDRLGRLTQVTDAAGNLTTMGYDQGGRKTSMSDPDMGAWTYAYNAAGSLTSQTDARAITTTLGYDALQRITSKTYSNAEPAVSFLYDIYPDTSYCTQAADTAKGMLTRTTDGAGEQLSCFDIRGREANTRRGIDGANYDFVRAFDALDQTSSITYPGGERVDYVSTAQGQIHKMYSVTAPYNDGFVFLGLSGATYTPWHGIATLPLGSIGQTTVYGYDSRARVSSIVTGPYQNLSFTYDDASNVTSITDVPGDDLLTYTYDNLDRLTGLSIDLGSGGTGAYTYNAIGNLLTKQEGASSLTLNYPSPGQPRPHGVTSTAGSQALTLTYDADGNLASMTPSGGQTSTYTFDAENRLTRRGTASGPYVYVYDGNGAVLKRATAHNSTAQTVTLRPNAEGAYLDWGTYPYTGPHFDKIDEAATDEDASYIEYFYYGGRDTHRYPGAGIPSDALVDKVTLKFRWKGPTGNGWLAPLYYQNGSAINGPGYNTGATYRTDQWERTTNPRTGAAWTAAEVNSGLEFGFISIWPGYTPRVTQAYVEVTYRAASDSTVYAGGLYEKKSNGDVTKYYEFAGRRIAMRTQVAALGAIETGAQCTNSTDDDGDTVVNDGCARYILSDHLGSTSTVVDRNGTTATVKYWPFGATRSSSGTLGTDKLYTGQQDEPNDPALGLYHYGARFYSTVLGRFASVDPIVGSASDPQSWNGYSYVRNNPLRYADPTGMDPVCLIMCGGSGHDVIVEDYRCHACAGKSAAEVDAIRLGMLAGAAFEMKRFWEGVAAAVAFDSALAQQWVETPPGVPVVAAAESGGKGSELFGIPVKCCVITSLGGNAMVIGPGAVGSSEAGIYTDSKDRTHVGAGAGGGGGASSIQLRSPVPKVSANVGVESKLGWSRAGSSAFANASGNAGVCVGVGASACFGVGLSNGGGWVEVSVGLGANWTGPLPVAMYGTLGGTALKKIRTPW